jgi:hypothetical protein
VSLTLYFLRHGETTYSKTGAYCGEVNAELTPDGEHDDEDDSKFRNLGLVGYSEILAIVGDIVRVKVPEEEVGISVTDCGPLCKRASSVAKSQEQKPSPTMLCGTFARVARRSSGAGSNCV